MRSHLCEFRPKWFGGHRSRELAVPSPEDVVQPLASHTSRVRILGSSLTHQPNQENESEDDIEDPLDEHRRDASSTGLGLLLRRPGINSSLTIPSQSGDKTSLLEARS